MNEENNIWSKLSKAKEEVKKKFLINDKEVIIDPIVTYGFTRCYSRIKKIGEKDARTFFCKLIYYSIEEEYKDKISLNELELCDDETLISIGSEFINNNEELEKTIKNIEEDKDYFDKFIDAIGQIKNEQDKEHKKLEENIGSIIPNVGFNSSFVRTPSSYKKTFDDVLDEELEDYKDEFNVYDSTCNICNKEIDKLFHWYYLKNTDDISESEVVCSLKCLKRFREQCDTIELFEIVEYKRCSAFFKCLEIDNIRGMCEKTNTLTTSQLKPFGLSNYCKPGQAGLILTTYKINEILEQFSEESNKQFKITTIMTILVIILTAMNLIPVFINENQRQIKELKKLNSSISQVTEKLDNRMNSIEKSIKSIKSTYNAQDIKLKKLNSLNDNIMKNSEQQINILEDLNNQLTDHVQNTEDYSKVQDNSQK